MMCAWKELMNILPLWMRREMEENCESAQNIRLRLDEKPEIQCSDQSRWLSNTCDSADLNFVINAASRYSPWAAATISQGYITAPGGHRIGICGEAVMKDGAMTGIREVKSLCIRVARDFPGIADELANLNGSTLILGAPGWGKTTLLRDLIRQKSDAGRYISVVDERRELFPPGFRRGARTDILFGCAKAQGIEILLRTMEPRIIAVDEITAGNDCLALKQAAWCGVDLIATAHASGLHDFLHREIYSPLVNQNLFENIVILHSDKSWHLERSKGWTSNGSARY